MHKPEGYNALSPYLIAEDAHRMIDMLQAVFGAEKLRSFEREDGTLMHAEIRIEDSVLMLAQSTSDWPPNQQLLHVYVLDADLTYRKAIEWGCQSLQEPAQKEGDPDRRGMFEDFSGNQWAVGTQQTPA